MLPNSYLEKKPTVAAAIAGLLLQAAAGTGSVYDIAHADKWVHEVSYRVPYKIDTISADTKPLDHPDLRNIRQHLDNIRQIFNLPISHIADLLHVSRQAVYKWLAGNSTPEQEKQNILTTLSHTADKFQEANISGADTLLKMKAFDGRSLIDILLLGEDASRYVAVLIDEAKIMQESYEKSGLSSSKTEPTNDWQSYISIPGSPEKD